MVSLMSSDSPRPRRAARREPVSALARVQGFWFGFQRGCRCSIRHIRPAWAAYLVLRSPAIYRRVVAKELLSAMAVPDHHRQRDLLYSPEIIRCRTKPHPVSWFVWGMLTAIGAVAAVVGKVGVPCRPIVLTAAVPLGVATHAAIRNETGRAWADKWSLAG